MRANKGSKISPARRVASEVLRRVEAEGAFSSLALNHALLRHGRMSQEDRALTTDLVYGTLRWRRYLDYALAAHSHRPLDKIEPLLLRTLRLSAYQLLFLDRVPAFAAVDQATEMARSQRGRRAANFVNGVLRGLSSNKEQITWPDPTQDSSRALGIIYSFPDWMTNWWLDLLGYEKTVALMKSFNLVAPRWVRVNTTRITQDRFCSLMSTSGFTTEICEDVPDAVLLKNVSEVQKIGAFETGLFHVQDAAAQTVCHLLDPRPGEKILDACGAPGGKTATIAQLMKDQGEIISADAHPARVSLTRKLQERLGIECVQAHSLDLTGNLPSEWGLFDRILLDAPCSAAGVIRRHPESKWRLSPKDIQHLTNIQFELLNSVSRSVKPGGILVYSVCSFSNQEGPDLVQQWLSKNQDFEYSDARESKKAPWHKLLDNTGALVTWPDIHNMDAFFAVRLKRKE